MKGLILAAGRGTRLRPLSYTKPKPLLPVANQPVIQYGINHLYNLGIREVGLVIQPGQTDVFNEYLQLEDKEDLVLHYIYQHEQKGIAHAVGQAEEFIGQDSFVLLLGDNLFDESLFPLEEAFNMNDIHATVMVTKVNKPKDYGIVEVKKKKIINVEEKPAKPKSNLAICGAYMFDVHIFKAIHSITPSARGEYEITDAIQWLIDHNYSINYVKASKPTFDVGTMERWLEANQWILRKYALPVDNDQVKNSVIIPPVKIGENCKIKNSVIGPYVSIEPNTTIKKCTIKNSIILKNSHLKNIPYEITESIFGENTKLIGKKSKNHLLHGLFSDDSSLIFSDVDETKKESNE
ncbi:NTP transferase domain-containing protein [Halobacillus sp. A1]|uniref:sugar phosphate nucleotidyltransferase n=1 Tax=Halobacillus sp. A1 TaxID=2880262 RepID=UPI0020A692D5|nr:sugar phosphate nucleotidyltransferase [Halobacillus sp. A1]MCP3029826.1 NTP transferase domain-containing protein [Halobacillus sp. A1]